MSFLHVIPRSEAARNLSLFEGEILRFAPDDVGETLGMTGDL
jgi:hypothetical protein